ncbi:GyrI-like domain-containing protein [[Eubacterium] cellulosolvens]
MAAQKLDLTKEYRTYYKASTTPELETFDEALYLAIEGIGAPAGDEFNKKVSALYPLAYGVKNLYKKAGSDFGVPKLEGLWWVDSDKPFIEIPREKWCWQLLIRMPEFVTFTMIEEAKEVVIKKKKLKLVNEISLHKMNEGLSVQVLHIGPYSTEPETIERMVDFIRDNNLVPNGLHHEIYLADPGRVPEDKLKTILRRPVRKVD